MHMRILRIYLHLVEVDASERRHIFDIDVARQIQFFRFADASGRYNIKINYMFDDIYGAVRQTEEFYNMAKCVRLHL